MKIEVSTCTEQENWDALLAQSIHPTIFHSWTWLKLVEKHTGAKLYPLVGHVGSNNIVFSTKTTGVS